MFIAGDEKENPLGKELVFLSDLPFRPEVVRVKDVIFIAITEKMVQATTKNIPLDEDGKQIAHLIVPGALHRHFDPGIVSVGAYYDCKVVVCITVVLLSAAEIQPAENKDENHPYQKPAKICSNKGLSVVLIAVVPIREDL